MKHFSHPHELQLWSTASLSSHQQTLMPTDSTTIPCCSACQLPSTENMHVCLPCNFTLHSSCAQFPQLITHPAHKNHALTLLPVAAYPGGIFNCDACNRRGNGFSYHCGSCEYDLHVLCASKPLNFTHPSHSCQLDLTFTNPYGNAKGFSCDVCHKFGSKQWLYRCSACEFDVHMDCIATIPATASAPASSAGVVVQFQGQASAPASTTVSQFQGQDRPQGQFLEHDGSFSAPYIHDQISLAHQQDMRRSSMGAHPITHRPQLGPTNMDLMGVGPVMSGPQIASPGVLMHCASTGQLRNSRPVGQVMHGPPAVRPDVLMPPVTSGLMNSVIEGSVEGAAQQVGQSLVQGVIGCGGGGGGGDGTSILGSFFEDSPHTQNLGPYFSEK